MLGLFVFIREKNKYYYERKQLYVPNTGFKGKDFIKSWQCPLGHVRMK